MISTLFLYWFIVWYALPCLGTLKWFWKLELDDEGYLENLKVFYSESFIRNLVAVIPFLNLLIVILYFYQCYRNWIIRKHLRKLLMTIEISLKQTEEQIKRDFSISEEAKEEALRSNEKIISQLRELREST